MRLPEEKVATLICSLNVRVEIDDRGNVNSESATLFGSGPIQKWGGRYALLPGRHKVGIRPYASFFWGGYKGLPDFLPECTLYFDAAAGQRYFVSTEHAAVDKTFAGQSGNTSTFIVDEIAYSFSIWEERTKKTVSTGEASLKGR